MGRLSVLAGRGRLEHASPGVYGPSWYLRTHEPLRRGRGCLSCGNADLTSLLGPYGYLLFSVWREHYGSLRDFHRSVPWPVRGVKFHDFNGKFLLAVRALESTMYESPITMSIHIAT